jgi:hypothetical protein
MTLLHLMSPNKRAFLPAASARIATFALSPMLALAMSLFVLCVPTMSAAQAPPPTRQAKSPPLPAWEQLSQAQRDALIAPMRERWNQNPQQRIRMMNHAQRWQQMTPEQRKRAQQGKRRWDNMTPQQRAEARAMFEQGQSLSPEQRAALREKIKTMTPEQRRAWLKQHRESSQGMQDRDPQGRPPRPVRSPPQVSPPQEPRP